MRRSEFQRLMEDEFGSAYAPTVERTQSLAALGGATAAEALAAGVEPRTVWTAVCEHMDIPPARRFGRDRPLKR